MLLEKRRSERGQTFREVLDEARRNGPAGHATISMPDQKIAGHEFKSFDPARPLMENMDKFTRWVD